MRVIQVGKSGTNHISRDNELRAACGASSRDFMPYEVDEPVDCQRCITLPAGQNLICGCTRNPLGHTRKEHPRAFTG